MAKTKYVAVFSNGEKIYRASERPYAYAWAVFDQGKLKAKGFSEAKDKATKAAYDRLNGVTGRKELNWMNKEKRWKNLADQSAAQARVVTREGQVTFEVVPCVAAMD